MLAGAIRDAILADDDIIGRLGRYTFETGSAPEPSVFTFDPVPEDDGNPADPEAYDTLPAITIVESVGEGLEGERSKSAAEPVARIKIVGKNDNAYEKYRRIAWKLWKLFDKNCEVRDDEGEFNILGTLAEPPQDLGRDPDGFPQFFLDVSAVVYTV